MEMEYNFYPIGSQAPSLAEENISTISSIQPTLIPNIIQGNGSSLIGGFNLKSKNYIKGVSGWALNEDGSVEFN